MYNYDPKSLKAEEFINHEEIEETLRYAEENKHNAELIDSISKRTRRYTSSQSRLRRTFTVTES